MATFTAHSILGAGFSVGVVKLLGLTDYRVVATVYGAISGMSPDALDWLAAKFGLFSRWGIYNQLHDTTLSKLWAIFILAQPPALIAHYLPDKIFHANSPNWWPKLWWLEILMWLVGFVLLYWGWT